MCQTGPQRVAFWPPIPRTGPISAKTVDEGQRGLGFRPPVGVQRLVSATRDRLTSGMFRRSKFVRTAFEHRARTNDGRSSNRQSQAEFR